MLGRRTGANDSEKCGRFGGGLRVSGAGTLLLTDVSIVAAILEVLQGG